MPSQTTESWNNPYSSQGDEGNILYSGFVDRPKHLDPARSYSEDEITFTAQIYEPPLQYHYLKRPYEVIPQTATSIPRQQYLDKEFKLIPADAQIERIAYTDYIITIRPGITYQPHPAFAVPENILQTERKLSDFVRVGSRELIAEDYVYEIKRLAHPRYSSPIFGLMAEHIVGLEKFGKELAIHQKNLSSKKQSAWLDLRPFALEGVQSLSRYSYRIRIKGKYPQFLYWLTMPFFAPIPWEADRFYNQPGMAERNLTLDWYPIGTGPYMLSENNPNAQMVLERNPNFRGETYPCDGSAEDKAAGLLLDCGKPLPFIDRAIFIREKEQLPYWNKFLQGYYDASGISSDSYDQALQTSSVGAIELSPAMRAQHIQLSTAVGISTSYLGFNMLDPIVGGNSARARGLRQAISIAIDQEEYIAIFLNGRGIPAQDPLPPGIFGANISGAPTAKGVSANFNHYVYRMGDHGPVRRSIEEARQILAKAGYPEGRDQQTGEPLMLYLDTTLSGLGSKSRVEWLNKQLRKISLQLVVRSTDYNRFQDKIAAGSAQLFYYGWNADYPDPENFLFLLYGPQGRVRYHGENSVNYENPEYDRLFEQMRNMTNNLERKIIIDRMLEILRRDAPWVWGLHPKDYTLNHAWLYNRKVLKVGNNSLKYQRIDPQLRSKLRLQWNQPVLWQPLVVLLSIVVVLLPVYWAHRKREWSKPLSDTGETQACKAKF